MGFVEFLAKLFGFGRRVPRYQFVEKYDCEELARRLGVHLEILRSISADYHEFTIPKRTGRRRSIAAPSEPLKEMQRKILHRLLGRLRSHPSATGFERGQSIVTNAIPHAASEVVIRMDVRDFFASTSAARVHQFFRFVGWDEQASKILTRICAHKDGLPQGAPTSPRLSNLVN
jgi:hypothetical protein